jgi:uncharacterized protein (TIRG00374 family)
MNKKKINFAISLIVGLVLFFGVIEYFGVDSLLDIYKKINLSYLLPYIFSTTIVFFINAWRFKYVIEAYGKKVDFWSQWRQGISWYGVSYITPVARLGGEPVKAYMLKKENKIDYRTGSSAIIIDRFIELTGSVLFGILGLVLIFFIPNIPAPAKIILGLVLLAGFLFLFFIYYFTIRQKGPFTYIFNILKFYKLKKLKKVGYVIKDVEKKMEKFFICHKKQFMMSLFFYFLYGIASFFEVKYLLLMLGVDASVIEIILVIVVWGATNFIPVPGALGFQEATQTGLFAIFMGSGEIGLAFALLTRIRALIFIVMGFSFISHTMGREFIRKKEKNQD